MSHSLYPGSDGDSYESYSAQYKYIFFVAQQPKSGLGRLVFKVSRSHTEFDPHTHTHIQLDTQTHNQ
jgi:hypothetical protein